MDKFNQLANEMLREYFRVNENNEMEEKSSNGHEFADQMVALIPEIFDAIHKQDKESHLVALKKYEDIKNKALEKFGIDGLAYSIDPEMASNYSDDFKDRNGMRPKQSTFRDVIEFYSNGNYGRIVNNEYIPNELVSYIGVEIEDNEMKQGINPDVKAGLNTVKAVQKLGVLPKERFLSVQSGEKALGKALDKVYVTLAKKVKDAAKALAKKDI